jgi:hypothetical protein
MGAGPADCGEDWIREEVREMTFYENLIADGFKAPDPPDGCILKKQDGPFVISLFNLYSGPVFNVSIGQRTGHFFSSDMGELKKLIEKAKDSLREGLNGK